jgi:lipoic acid synthetase
LEGRKKPSWLRYTLPSKGYEGTKAILERHGVRTVCVSTRCPNLPRCWSEGSATFMILGGSCTRDCRFCAVPHGIPEDDPTEAGRVADAVRSLQLGHVVITSVTRDDLPDQGVGTFVKVTDLIRECSPATTIELLVPDLWGMERLASRLVACGPDVIGHNLETVERLTPAIRDGAEYRRSLRTLTLLKHAGATTKSSLMLGLGETEGEVIEAMGDLIAAGVDLLTLGQYLRPKGSDLPVCEYVRPEAFEGYRDKALSMGFRHVASGPFVRSSFKAVEALGHIRGEN